MNPLRYRIPKERWQEFQEHYTWQLLKTPDYRLGQAFLNYFSEVDEIMTKDGDLGIQDSVALYYESDNGRAMDIIITWLE
jgi:hypothetical protein